MEENRFQPIRNIGWMNENMNTGNANKNKNKNRGNNNVTMNGSKNRNNKNRGTNKKRRLNNNNSKKNNNGNRSAKRTRTKAFRFANGIPNLHTQEPEFNNSRRSAIGPGHRTRTRALLGQAPQPRFNAPLQKALATLSAVAHSEGNNLEQMMNYVNDENTIPPHIKEMVKRNLTRKYPMLSSSGQSNIWNNNS